MNTRRLATSMALLSLSSCGQPTDLPVAHDVIAVEGRIEAVVCHLRVLSRSNDLSFHYGTYGSAGSLGNFRLIGDGYEVTIVTPKERMYDVSVYDLKESPVTRVRALNAYKAIKGGLSGPLPPACRT